MNIYHAPGIVMKFYFNISSALVDTSAAGLSSAECDAEQRIELKKVV